MRVLNFKQFLTAAFLVFFAVPHAIAAELVMVEQAGCSWCAKWNTEISHIYPNTDDGKRAPLRRVDLRDLPPDIIFTSRPVFTPTFVLVDGGAEVGRIEGYGGDQFFWFHLATLLERLPGGPPPAQE